MWFLWPACALGDDDLLASGRRGLTPDARRRRRAHHLPATVPEPTFGQYHVHLLQQRLVGAGIVPRGNACGGKRDGAAGVFVLLFLVGAMIL